MSLAAACAYNAFMHFYSAFPYKPVSFCKPRASQPSRIENKTRYNGCLKAGVTALLADMSPRCFEAKHPGILMQPAITWILKSSFLTSDSYRRQLQQPSKKGHADSSVSLATWFLPSSPRRPLSFAEWGRAPRGKIASNHITGGTALTHKGTRARLRSLQF